MTADAPMTFDDEMRARARVVERQHARGNRCDECPTAPGERACVRLAIWWPVIVQVRAEREAS